MRSATEWRLMFCPLILSFWLMLRVMAIVKHTRICVPIMVIIVALILRMVVIL